MAKKKITKKQQTKSQAATEKVRQAAIKEIDERLNGEAKPAKGKSAGARKTASKMAVSKKAPAQKAKTPRKPSGLDLAAKVLQEAKEPLNAKTIAERAIAAGWETKGATPHATIYAAIIREIQNKGDASRFEKVDRGRFQIRTGA